MTGTFPPQNNPAPGSKSSATPWLIGCGIGCLSLIVILIAAVAGSAWWLKSYVDRNSAPFLQQGYKKVSGQMLDVTVPVTAPTLYVGQLIQFQTTSTADVAIIAQMAEVQGKIGGKLSFRGQVLIIDPGAEIAGDLDVQAQALQNQGTVRGQITGKFQAVTGQNLKLPRIPR